MPLIIETYILKRIWIKKMNRNELLAYRIRPKSLEQKGGKN